MERIDRGARRTVWRPAQAEALPARLTEPNAFGMTKEIVVENEIGWRIETLADYLAAGGVRLISRSDSNHERRDRLEDTAHTIIESNGGSLLIQEMAILGSIYGHVDLLIRRDGAAAHGDHERGRPHTHASPRDPSCTACSGAARTSRLSHAARFAPSASPS